MERHEAEKIAIHSSLPQFPLSAMHEAVEAVLPNNFTKQINFNEKTAHEAIFQIKSTTSEVVLSQTISNLTKLIGKI